MRTTITRPHRPEHAHFPESGPRRRSAAGPPLPVQLPRPTAARAELLTRALGLWHGPAYADVADAGYVRAAAAGLEEQRVTAHEELAEARLELGDHALDADQLAALAAQIRALYGARRQSEALTVYGQVRERFAEELGTRRGGVRQDPAGPRGGRTAGGGGP
ncbi:BTAD domain-containing putative transcriptional regulator [Streptomyces sp. NPDC059982]|uniref:AfsR/SARP family transcriptional regulator n=1 Tax=unclassified Streptomyces TaxID=2593676 RepID=UPI0036AF0729